MVQFCKKLNCSERECADSLESDAIEAPRSKRIKNDTLTEITYWKHPEPRKVRSRIKYANLKCFVGSSLSQVYGVIYLRTVHFLSSQ